MLPLVEPMTKRWSSFPSSSIARLKPSSSKASPNGVPLPWILRKNHVRKSLGFCYGTDGFDLLCICQVLRRHSRHLPSCLDHFGLSTRRRHLVSCLFQSTIRSGACSKNLGVHLCVILDGQRTSLDNNGDNTISRDGAVSASVEGVTLAAR